MQGMYICFVFIALLKSAATLKSQKFGFMVIFKEGIHTTYPSNTTTEYTTQGTTGYQLKNQTDKDKPKNLAHSENNALDETKTTGVLIFVLFTIITVLALTIYLAVLKKQNGAYEITKRQDIESHEMT